MDALPFIITSAGLLIGLLCIPLARGKIGPNLFYGIRTRAAFASKENWYRINKSAEKSFSALPASSPLSGWQDSWSQRNTSAGRESLPQFLFSDRFSARL